MCFVVLYYGNIPPWGLFMKLKVILLFFVLYISSFKLFAQNGCVVKNFDGFDKVFNNLRTGNQYRSGDGNNFVLWAGACGPHQYIEVGQSLGTTCTLVGYPNTGTVWTIVRGPFGMPCPIDNYVWFIMVSICGIGFVFIRKNN